MMTNEIAVTIRDMFLSYGHESYGEDMTVLSHSLQSADIAEKENLSEALIITALLHDIGHILPKYFNEETISMSSYGTLQHETIAKDFLNKNGFSASITEPIFLHVDAKRYLCTKNDEYYNTLSKASKATMEFQGGMMSMEEIIKFESNPFFKDALKLRYIDDLAKETTYDDSSEKLDYWMNRLNKFLN